MASSGASRANDPAAFGAAIQGARAEQQDSFRLIGLADEAAWLLVVADGMGGHAGGTEASRMAADGFVAAFIAARAARHSLDGALQDALERANRAVAEGQAGNPELAGMGTTLVGAHLSASGLAWISVGDSPLWLYRDMTLTRLNEDHSLRLLVKEAGAGHGNMLRSALTGEPIAMIDCHPEPLPLAGGDLILLASDGILTLDEAQIARTVGNSGTRHPELLAWLLLNAVQDRGEPGQDNCTLIIAAAAPGASAKVPALVWCGAAALAAAAAGLAFTLLS